MDDTDSKDWSTRHVRLRFELIATSMLIYAFVHYKTPLKASVLLPIDLSGVPSEVFFKVLIGFYIFTFVHFIMRTKIERGEITSFANRLANVADRCRDARVQLNEPFSAVEGTPFGTGSVSALRRVEDIASRWHEISSLTKRARDLVEKAEAETNSSTGGGPLRLEELHVMFKDYGDIGEKTAMAKIATTELEAVLREYKASIDILEKDLSERVRNLKMPLQELRSFERDFRMGKNTFSVERMLLSAYAPAIISGILVLCSLTTIYRLGHLPS